MFSPAIAADLRELGHDVIAAADRPDLQVRFELLEPGLVPKH
jgi:hypothetical protein